MITAMFQIIKINSKFSHFLLTFKSSQFIRSSTHNASMSCAASAGSIISVTIASGMLAASVGKSATGRAATSFSSAVASATGVAAASTMLGNGADSSDDGKISLTVTVSSSADGSSKETGVSETTPGASSIEPLPSMISNGGVDVVGRASVVVITTAGDSVTTGASVIAGLSVVVVVSVVDITVVSTVVASEVVLVVVVVDVVVVVLVVVEDVVVGASVLATVEDCVVV